MMKKLLFVYCICMLSTTLILSKEPAQARIETICTEIDRLIPQYNNKCSIAVWGIAIGTIANYLGLQALLDQRVRSDQALSSAKTLVLIGGTIWFVTALAATGMSDLEERICLLLYELRLINQDGYEKFYKYLGKLYFTEQTFWNSYNKIIEKQRAANTIQNT